MRRAWTLEEEAAGEEEQINLTPLIDVVFVVLILFILIAPLLDIDRIELAAAGSLTKQERPLSSDKSPVEIHVLADNTVELNHSPVAIGELCAHLIELQQLHPAAIPQIFHDKRAFFGTYQGVKGAVEKAGFGEMDVILKPGE